MKQTKSPLSTPSKNGSENLATALERRNFKDIDSFVQQLDDYELEVKPKPTSQKQSIISDKLALTINMYRASNLRLKAMLKGQEIKESRQDELHPKNDWERQQITETLQVLTPEEIDKIWQEKYDVAAQLRLCITQAKTHGMVRPGPAVLKQLKHCRDENIRLNNELVILGAKHEDLNKKYEGLLKLYPDARERMRKNE